MLKHYLEQISESEFSERNLEIPNLVAKEKMGTNARGVLNSTITLHALANFFSAEFVVRCDFLKSFILSHSNLLINNSDKDPATVAKELFQSVSFTERDKIKNLYKSGIKPIEKSLSNENMKKQIEDNFITKMEACIQKNNLYIEIAYKEIAAAKANRNPWLILQPNFSGIGIDLRELWNRYFKNNL